jgi:hypothetical protein
LKIIRTALALGVRPGSEQAYLDWLGSSMSALAPVYARTGIRSKAVMMAGQQLIAVYEADRPGAVDAAFAQPESLEMLSGRLGELLDPALAPRSYESVLTWRAPVAYTPRHVALMMNLKAGQGPAYLEWVRDTAVSQFEAVWRRFDLGLKEVLVNGESVIAHYECRDSASVLATFGEPEAVEAMTTNLGPLLDLDPAQPLAVFEEIFRWQVPAA